MDAAVLTDVRKAFGDVKAVEALTARVPGGSIYGFLGPNGAGKTTVIRMMMDIISPDAGQIHILGSDSVARIKDRIGYMPEERGLYQKMTVRDLLMYLASLKGMKKTDSVAVIRDWLKTVELTGWAERRVHELSRGMQQRLQFVAAAIHDPDLLILDEPFSGLDPVNLDLLKGIVLGMRRAGKSIILSTHMMEQAEEMCDFILLINEGRKVLDGSLDDIRRRHETGAAVVELEGDTSFVSDLPMVTSVTPKRGKLEITLKEGARDQELLQALMAKARVRTFQLKTPTLHEIFVSVVRERGG